MQTPETLPQGKRPESRYTETLREFPALRYLLGTVTPESVGTDSRPDGVSRSIHYVTEGSGMFGLTHPEDAMRWKGIFNHVMGSARQVYWLADRLKSVLSREVQEFVKRGFFLSTQMQISPIDLRDFMFVSHAGRRQADEYIWHTLRDRAHPSGDSGRNTFTLLHNTGAPQRYLDLMRVETRAEELVDPRTGDHMPKVIDNILTYCDWTFWQTPITLDERFAGLRKSNRAAPEILDVLEKCGKSFESALKEIVDRDIFEHMTHAGPYAWETKIRRAYCAPSGLAMEIVFPGYKA